MSIFRPSPRIFLAAMTVLAAAACATTPASDTPATPAAPSTPAPVAKPAAPAPAAVAAVAPASFAICGACHATTANAPPKLGPNLHGVMGRKAGTAAGFDSSDAMKNSGITWNATNLQAFVQDPGKTVPNNDMDYPGVPDATAAKAIVDYMATLK